MWVTNPRYKEYCAAYNNLQLLPNHKKIYLINFTHLSQQTKIFLAVIPCLDDSLLCSADGLCGYNLTANKFQCSCKPGYTGDGLVCKGKKIDKSII